MSRFTKGILKHWNRDRAFGFITVTDEFGIRTDAFVHVSNVLSGPPVIGCECEFVMEHALKGATALQVTFSTPLEPDTLASEPQTTIEPQTALELKLKQDAALLDAGQEVLAGRFR